MNRLLPAILAFALSACATTPPENAVIDLQSVTKSGKPNQYLVAPEGYLTSETPDAIAPVFAKGTDEVFDAALSAVRDAQGAHGIEASQDKGRIRYVAQVFIFKDDVDIAVLPHPDGATIAIFSRSRVGYSDLGVNRKRVEALIGSLQGELS